MLSSSLLSELYELFVVACLRCLPALRARALRSKQVEAGEAVLSSRKLRVVFGTQYAGVDLCAKAWQGGCTPVLYHRDVDLCSCHYCKVCVRVCVCLNIMLGDVWFCANGLLSSFPNPGDLSL